MRELPILFNTPMVQAILEGRKTMTRRVIKPKTLEKFINLIWNPNENLRFSPYQPGDRLWVQETWKIDSLLRDRPDYPVAIDFKAVQNGYSQAEIMCKFTQDRFEKFKKFYKKPGWQSPYFMPKEAARIWLEVTGVRVERLQEIAEEDALNEGIQGYTKDGILYKYCVNYDSWAENFKAPKRISQTPWQGMPHSAIEAFSQLWDSTLPKPNNKFKRNMNSWSDNPWVWAISFRRVEP